MEDLGWGGIPGMEKGWVLLSAPHGTARARKGLPNPEADPRRDKQKATSNLCMGPSAAASCVIQSPQRTTSCQASCLHTVSLAQQQGERFWHRAPSVTGSKA